MRVTLCGSSLPQVGHPLSCNCFSKGKDGRKRGGARSGTMAQVHSFFVPDIPYFVRFDRNERLTIAPSTTIILLFTYSLKPFLSATKEGYEWLFARELAKSEYMCRISCGTVGKETNCQPLQQKAMWSGSLLNFRCQTPP